MEMPCQPVPALDKEESREREKAESSQASFQTKENAINGQQVNSFRTGKKLESRRRKSSSKPRRIRQIDTDLALETNDEDARKGKNLDYVLQQVIKAKPVEENKRESPKQENKMIDMHETLALRHHSSPKGVRGPTTSPGSVESAGSLYSNERNEDNLSDNGITNSPEPFVKIRPNNSENPPLDATPTYGVSPQRSLSSDAIHRRPSTSPIQVSSPKDLEAPISIPGGISQRSFSSSPSHVVSIPYEAINAHSTSAIAAMAAGMGLPTMIPTSATATMPQLLPIAEHRYRPDAGAYIDAKNLNRESESKTFQARGIIGSNANVNRSLTSVTPPPEDRAQYKRPPHTYPALIASAILDSPGHLITLRGIYDYIMNHFPYYKYCHDKSAWQNSIRHNLSLNQCFVKVPRYENAAKSNYWTMTREGFEEFGNENSFKRRRRRGAALAPISAYKAIKAKKFSNEGAKHGSKGKADSNKNHQSANPTSATSSPSDVGYPMSFPNQLMGLAGGAWAAGNGFQNDEGSARGRKRSQSPQGPEGAKHPRMMILKQGDGPSLGGIRSDEPRRPNSLSSVEEMQGNLNVFSKTLLDSSMQSKMSRKTDTSHLLATSSQPWLAAAQKSLIATSGMIMPPLITSDRSSSSPGKSGLQFADEGYAGSESPVLVDGVEVGSEVTIRYDASEMPIRHFRCRFCAYTYVSASAALLEQHVRVMHQLELTNAKAKAVAAAAVAQNQNDRNADNVKSKESSERLMSLQNMVTGLSPRSMMAQNFLAAAQASGGGAVSGFPYSNTFPSGLLDENMMRSLAEQVRSGQAGQATGEVENGLSDMDAYAAYQRQQALNAALQQAAAASCTNVSQEQLRLFYQQLALNPFISNPANSALAAAAFPRPTPGAETEQSNQLKNIWQYQQKFLSQMKALSSDDSDKTASQSPNSRSTATAASVITQPNTVSLCRSPDSNPDLDSDSRKSIHGWQCARCDFTAKGDHGLDLHYRKAHAQNDAMTSSGANETADDMTVKGSSPNLEIAQNEPSSNEKPSAANFEANKYESDSPITSPAFPTPPLSNSPSYVKRHFVPLDLSGTPKEDEEDKRKPGPTATSSTQTVQSKEERTCRHCDITFGDEMMLALHMSCHDKTDPFKCTICGQVCHEKYYFNVHLLRGLHQTNSYKSNGEPIADEIPDLENRFGSRRNSNSSDTSSVATSRGRVTSENGEMPVMQ
ncbi:uncharacterized protein LOC143458611 isoform X2 [Clavelina lepadiformis]|uniref:uncharacterized protein LOC143458611 isoform X2 n=1 Tax=Clavelina lepadiformis TaxID=159417 RepID=UPI0040417BED